ncbi:MAG: RNA polymerase sigma factor [Chloroflexi bacterium]|nr:RNA polymerase sigma factor [Chloroflexota bacterium]
MTDEEAIDRCQKGQREAFRHLVERYKDVLYGTAWLMTRDAAVAEDMVQEAFISAWQGIRGFQKGRPVKPWLARIVVNKVLSQRRRAVLPAASLDDAERHNPVNPGFVENLDHRDEVERALGKLSEEHRRAIILKYFADLSLAEVGAVTGCKEGTVKSRLNRALENLRGLLREGRHE